MEACNNPDFLRVMLFGINLLKVLFIFIPIGLIIMVIVDFFKNVTSFSGSDTQKNLALAAKRILYCVLAFSVPYVVGAINNTLVKLNLATSYTSCISNADIAYIEEREIEVADEALAKARSERTTKAIAEAEDAINKISDVSAKKTRRDELETIKEQVEGNNNTPSPNPNPGSNSTTSNLATGYLKSPLNPNASHDEYISSIRDNSQTLYYSDGRYHGGTDLPVVIGTNVYAMDGGTVFKVQDNCGSYGRHIILEHVVNGKKYYTIYAHLSKIESKFLVKDTTVNQGDLIAQSGNTYHCTGQTSVGAHLHIGISYNSGGSFPQTEGDRSFLISNFIGTGVSYSVVDDSNLSTYKTRR